MRVVVYTRQACPLCTTGIEMAQAVFGEDRITLVDIDLDLDLLEDYSDRVPVIETLDGAVIDEGIITECALRAYIVSCRR
jgi:Glutaredoxin-like domain (DUF836)